MAHAAPHILICSEESKRDDQFTDLITAHLPPVDIVRTTNDALFSLLSRQSHHVLFLLVHNPESADFKSRLVKLLSFFPNLIIVPVFPADRNDCLQAVTELDIFHYLTQPLDQAETELVLKRLLAKLDFLLTSSYPSRHTPAIPGFIGAGPAMSKLFELIRRVAKDDYATVMIRGESGTGKELVAKAIHTLSNRNAHNFVPVNCAAIPDDLLESELFGHLKGSFTGASQNKTGRIQYADKGTLFLDEIGDMKPALQAKLLRVLQEKEFEPVGSLKGIPVDTRIVAATHCNLEEMVRQGAFREDLYYRLSVVPIDVPPLRERTEDIPLLLDRFVSMFTVERGRDKIMFTPEAVTLLMKYDWRGNVRELENLVQHMSILCSGRKVRPQDLPDKILGNDWKQTLSDSLPGFSASPHPPQEDFLPERAELFTPLQSDKQSIDLDYGPVDFNELINEFESELIVLAMKQSSGNKKEAARLLNLKRTTLLEKIKKKGLDGHW